MHDRLKELLGLRKKLTAHPEWAEFESALVREYPHNAVNTLVSVIYDAIYDPQAVQTLTDLRNTIETVRAQLEQTKRTLLAHWPHLRGHDAPLVDHINKAIERIVDPQVVEWARYIDRLPHRRGPKFDARRLILVVNAVFPDLGLEMLAKIARIIFDDPDVTKRFAQSVLEEQRRWEEANPLLREANRRRNEARRKNRTA